MFACLSVCLSVGLSVCLSVGLSVHLSICLSVSLFVYMLICLSVCQSVCLFTCLFACLSVCQSVFLHAYLPVCLSVCLHAYLPVCLSVYPPPFFHLLRRHVEGERPHVDLLVRVHAGDDKEDPRPARATAQQATKAEDHHALVLLDNLKQFFLIRKKHAHFSGGKTELQCMQNLWGKCFCFWEHEFCKFLGK